MRVPTHRAATAAVMILAALAATRPARADKNWPPLPPGVWTATRPSVEPDADAEVMLWEVKVEDWLEEGGLVSVREHFVRVRVFTEKGAQDWSKHEIDYNRSGISVSDLAARTIKADGTIVTMARNAISKETLVKSSEGQLKRITFAPAGVEPGCIVEYRYREHRRDASVYFSTYYFQLEIPVQRVVYRIRPLELPGLAVRRLQFHVAAQSSPTPTNGYFETSASNQRAFRTERDMPPRAQEIGFMVVFYTTSDKNTPDDFWPQAGRARAETFDQKAKPDKLMREAAQSLVAGAGSDRERVERIARWLQSDFQVVRSSSPDSLRVRGLRDPDDARAAWRQKGGGYWDALMVFGALARGAGLEARWVMVPSRSRLFFDRNMLHESFLTSFQVAVRIDGRWATFDPVTRYLPWDMRPWDEEACMALLCDRDSSVFIGTGYSEPEHSVQARTANLELRPDGSLEGALRVSWTGHFNAEQRLEFEDATPEELDSLAVETQRGAGTKVVITGATLARGANERDPLALTGNVKLPQFASVTRKRIVLEPATFQAHAKPRYTSSSRQHPVYYRYPWTELDTVRITIPEGWKMETADHVPPVVAENVADYSAAVMVSEDERQILYVRRFRMGINGSNFFPLESYAGVKELFDKVQQRDRVALTLVRVDAGP